MDPVTEEVLCCQYAAVSLSPITADNFLEFSFFNKQYEQSIFSTSSTNSAEAELHWGMRLSTQYFS